YCSQVVHHWLAGNGNHCPPTSSPENSHLDRGYGRGFSLGIGISLIIKNSLTGSDNFSRLMFETQEKLRAFAHRTKPRLRVIVKIPDTQKRLDACNTNRCRRDALSRKQHNAPTRKQVQAALSAFSTQPATDASAASSLPTSLPPAC